MNISDFTGAKEETVLKHVVFKENTLGYLFKASGNLKLGVLSGSVVKGGLDWMSEPKTLKNEDFDHLRTATRKDFDFFRVSSKGYGLQ